MTNPVTPNMGRGVPYAYNFGESRPMTNVPSHRYPL